MASLPMIVVFAVFGDYLILLWMGADFVAPGLAYVLALMALINLDYGISSRVLAGLDAHGRIALLCFASTVIVFVGLYLALAPLDVTEAAWMAAIATAAGVSVPHFFLASLRLGTRPLEYFRAVYQNGLLANLVFLAGLLYGRELAEAGALGWASAVGLGSAGVLAALYWRFGISPGARASLSQSLRARRV